MNNSHRRTNPEILEILTKSFGREPAFDGTVLEGRARRYTVVNESDIKKYVPANVKETFEHIVDLVGIHIEAGRTEDGKKPFNNYIVINLDEPYIGEIIEVMKRHGHWD